MPNYATKQDVQEIVERAVNKAVDDLSEVIAGFAQQVDARFNDVEHRLAKLEGNIDRLETTLDAFLARIDRYETEQAARDRQFQRLLDWARKVSEKTGIPLENL
jgi:septal ring factor EnvC (AmiA/AmiB activator)